MKSISFSITSNGRNYDLYNLHADAVVNLELLTKNDLINLIEQRYKSGEKQKRYETTIYLVELLIHELLELHQVTIKQFIDTVSRLTLDTEGYTEKSRFYAISGSTGCGRFKTRRLQALHGILLEIWKITPNHNKNKYLGYGNNSQVITIE